MTTALLPARSSLMPATPTQLRFVNGDGASITRAVNLGGVTSATLTFTYDRNNNGSTTSTPAKILQVQYSPTGSFTAGNFTVLGTIGSTSGNFAVPEHSPPI